MMTNEVPSDETPVFEFCFLFFLVCVCVSLSLCYSYIPNENRDLLHVPTMLSVSPKPEKSISESIHI